MSALTLVAGLSGAGSTYDPIDLAFHLFVCLYGLLSAAALHRYFRYSSDLLAPLPGTLLLLFLYSAASALYAREYGQTLFGDTITRRAAGLAYISAILGCVGLSLGNLSSRARNAGYLLEPIGRRSQLTDHSFFVACALIGCFTFLVFFSSASSRFNFISVASYADTALSGRVDRMEEASAGVEEVLFVYLPVFTLLAASIMLIFDTRRLWLRIVGAAVVLSYLATNTLAGSRRSVVEVLVMLAVYVHYRVRPIRWAEGVGGGVALYLFVNLLSIARISSDPALMIGAIQERWQDIGVSSVGLASSGELLTGLNLHRLIDGIDSGETSYTYGKSVWQELLVVVPKVIFPNRPLPLSEQFVEVFYPGVRESGGGYGLFVLQEGYWAAGLLGVLLSMFALGYATESLYCRVRVAGFGAFATFVYASVFGALVMGVVRSGIMSSFKAALLSCIPLVAARLLVSPVSRISATLTRPRKSTS